MAERVDVLPRYRPDSPPDARDAESLTRYIFSELERISDCLNGVADGQLEETFVEPEKPRTGMFRLADGTYWDPGSGRREYWYDEGDAQWHANLSVPAGTPLTVPDGGTGLAGGTSGGILGFTGPTTLASSALLSAGRIVLGGGAGATPSTPLGLGTSTQVLHGNASGAPTWGAVALTADVSGVLPVANGGVGLSTIAANSVLYAPALDTYGSSANLTYNGSRLAVGNTGVPGIGVGAAGVGSISIGDPTSSGAVKHLRISVDGTNADIQSFASTPLRLNPGGGGAITLGTNTTVSGSLTMSGNTFDVGGSGTGLRLTAVSGNPRQIQSFSSQPLQINPAGNNVAIGFSGTPTARLHLPAGGTGASAAPLKFTSGSLQSTAEAGAVEFLTDKIYLTITTGAARKELTLNESALTVNRLPFVNLSGRLTDSANLNVDSSNWILGTKTFDGQVGGGASFRHWDGISGGGGTERWELGFNSGAGTGFYLYSVYDGGRYIFHEDQANGQLTIYPAGSRNVAIGKATAATASLDVAGSGAFSTTLSVAGTGTVLQMLGGGSDNKAWQIQNGGATNSAYMGMTAAAGYVGTAAAGDSFWRNDGSSILLSAGVAGASHQLKIASTGVQFGTYTAAAVAQTGYITVKDLGGTDRRLLVG